MLIHQKLTIRTTTYPGHKARFTHQLLLHASTLAAAALLLALSAKDANAQQSEPIFSYENPSNEMDFDMPPLPDLKSTVPPPPSEDPLSEVDRFFSDAPVLEDPQEPEPSAVAPSPDEESAVKNPEAPEVMKADEVKKAEKPAKKKQYVRQMLPKPPFSFKSVVLPETIYRKYYTQANRHLPVAQYTSDMERGVISASAQGQISNMRGLKRIGTPLNVTTDSGEPALAIAARMGDLNTLHWLLIQGADSNAAGPQGITALHYAAFRGSWEMADVLLSYGANPNQPDDHGMTPLMYAARAASPDTVETLLDFGADASVVTANGSNAMSMASAAGDTITQNLLQRGY